MTEKQIIKLKMKFDSILDYKNKIEFVIENFNYKKLPFIIYDETYKSFSSYKPSNVEDNFNNIDYVHPVQLTLLEEIEKAKRERDIIDPMSTLFNPEDTNYFDDKFTIEINQSKYYFDIFPKEIQQLIIYGQIINKINKVAFKKLKLNYPIKDLLELKTLLLKSNKYKSDYIESKLFLEEINEIEDYCENYKDSFFQFFNKSYRLGKYSSTEKYELDAEFAHVPIESYTMFYSGCILKEINNIFYSDTTKVTRGAKPIDFTNIKIDEFIEFLLTKNINYKDSKNPQYFISKNDTNEVLLKKIFIKKSIHPHKIIFNGDQKTLVTLFTFLFRKFNPNKANAQDLAFWIANNFSLQDKANLDGSEKGYINSIITKELRQVQSHATKKVEDLFYNILCSVKSYIRT